MGIGRGGGGKDMAAMEAAYRQTEDIYLDISLMPAFPVRPVVKAAPVPVKAAPVQVKAAPVQVKAAPVQVKAAPVQVKAAPDPVPVTPATAKSTKKCSSRSKSRVTGSSSRSSSVSGRSTGKTVADPTAVTVADTAVTVADLSAVTAASSSPSAATTTATNGQPLIRAVSAPAGPKFYGESPITFVDCFCSAVTAGNRHHYIAFLTSGAKLGSYGEEYDLGAPVGMYCFTLNNCFIILFAGYWFQLAFKSLGMLATGWQQGLLHRCGAVVCAHIQRGKQMLRLFIFKNIPF